MIMSETMCYQCPVCSSKNCEEKDKLITCLDCGTSFRVYEMKEVFQRVFRTQKKTFDTLAGVNYCEKQVED
jgi:hypothetical protein